MAFDRIYENSDIPNCPYCGKPMYIGSVSTGGGDGGWAAIHEPEEDDEDAFFVFVDEIGCGAEFKVCRTPKEAEKAYKEAVYMEGRYGLESY